VRPELIALLAVGCGAAPPNLPVIDGPIDPGAAAPLGIEAAHWLPGERLSYDVKFRGVVLAEMHLAVGELGVVRGREVVVVKSRAATAGLVGLVGVRGSEEATSWIDLETGGALERHTRLDENGEIREYRLEMSSGSTRITRVGGGSYDHRTPPGPMFDNQSILGALRGWRPPHGAIAQYWALTDRILNRHVVRYSGHEVISSKTRHTRCDRYDADIYSPSGLMRDDQSYRIWITADVRRTPLRIEIPHRLGRVILELREHELGR
jgi:hypothetical protein